MRQIYYTILIHIRLEFKLSHNVNSQWEYMATCLETLVRNGHEKMTCNAALQHAQHPANRKLHTTLEYAYDHLKSRAELPIDSLIGMSKEQIEEEKRVRNLCREFIKSVEIIKGSLDSESS